MAEPEDRDEPATDTGEASEDRRRPENHAESPGETDRPNGERSADADGRATGKAADPGAKDTSHIANVVNIFQEKVNAGLVGIGGGAGQRVTPRSLTGRIEEPEITAETEFYCRPPTFEEAVRRLATDHVLSIWGATGIGKRTGAINLLRAVTNERLVVMSAVSDLKDLSTRTYTKGYGYLIVDRIDSGAKGDVDFAWRTVRDRVRRAGAYLVVTTVAVDAHVEAVAHIAWARPDLVAMCRTHLAGVPIAPEPDGPTDEGAADADAEQSLTTIAQHFGTECSMADITATLRAIRDGEKPEAALGKLSETSARRVREWLDKHDKDLPAILDVTALAFLGSVTYREFESLRGALEECMERRGVRKPAPAKGEKSDDAADTSYLGGRLGLVREDGLICERRTAGRTGDRRVLWFRSDSYRRHVLAELSGRCQAPFWNAVADWLTAMVASQPDPQIAIGLAELAGADFDEVEHSYLEPWSRGEVGPTGQTTVVFIVWAMCFRDDIQPVALKVVKQWANHGDPEQRWAAAMAYSGVLGACDPVQAIRQLWQLVLSAARGFDQASYAMAMLFGTLLETDNAGKVLTTLEQQVFRPQVKPADLRIVTRARWVLAQILVMRENRPRVPATFLYLERHPERLDLVARLWAEGICYRPHRQEVLQALWHGLDRLRQITEEPLEFARELGEALVTALPPTEVDAFYEQLKVVDAHTRDRGKPRRSPALVLLDVVGRHYRRKAS